jgi:hypothetical protein
MKLTIAALLIAAPLLASTAAIAQTMNADDMKWINQCINDNKDNKEGASGDVVRKYCMCMNEKMGNNESQSITVWEKTHTTERTACDKESGWK